MRTALALLLALWCTPTLAQEVSKPQGLAQFDGLWVGNSSIVINGNREAIRCNLRNASHGPTMHISLRCAGASFSMSVSADVRQSGSALRGEWSESQYSVSGSLSGTLAGERMNLAARGENFSADIVALRTAGGVSLTFVPHTQMASKFSAALTSYRK